MGKDFGSFWKRAGPAQRLLAHPYRHWRAMPHTRVKRQGHNIRTKANDQ